MNREQLGMGDRAANQDRPATPTVRWDDSNMRSLYANVVNATGTREEIVLLFGVNQAWHNGAKEIAVQLQDRVILSPYAAKRLNMLLGHIIREYESRYGELTLTAGPGQVEPDVPPAR